MTDVVAAIEARLGEMEAVAKAVRADWDAEDAHEQDEMHARQPHSASCGWRLGEGLARECECHYPAAVLRMVAGLRAVVALHVEGDYYGCAVCCLDWGEAMTGDNAQAEPWPCPTLLAIAAMFPATPTRGPGGSEEGR